MLPQQFDHANRLILLLDFGGFGDFHHQALSHAWGILQQLFHIFAEFGALQRKPGKIAGNAGAARRPRSLTHRTDHGPIKFLGQAHRFGQRHEFARM